MSIYTPVNNSENFTYCYTWSDLRENQDKLKLMDEKFVAAMGATIPNSVKVGDVFLITGFIGRDIIVDNKFTIPAKYLDFFKANC